MYNKTPHCRICISMRLLSNIAPTPLTVRWDDFSEYVLFSNDASICLLLNVNFAFDVICEKQDQEKTLSLQIIQSTEVSDICLMFMAIVIEITFS